MTHSIDVSHVNKTFRRYRPDRPNSIQEVLARGVRGLGGSERFHVLKDVSFTVPRGSAVGIIGTNGSGKSTLLRLIGGIGRVDSGRIAVAGRVGALLDLGSGFHSDLSGRENVIVAGVLAGLTRQEVLKRFDAIVAFAEVEKFIDNPLRTYSSGMHMRLAFATAVHTDPEVLLIDEVLAVGDAPFQRKCLARIARFKAEGCSLLLVSHGHAAIRALCNQALWLDRGRLMAMGAVPDVVKRYETHVGHTMELRVPDGQTPVGAIAATTSAASAVAAPPLPELLTPVRVTNAALYGPDGLPLAEVRAGHPLTVYFNYEFEPSARPRFGVTVRREDGLVCSALVMKAEDVERAIAVSTGGRGRMALVLERLDLVTGHYRVDITAVDDDGAPVDSSHVCGCTLTVIGGDIEGGVLSVPRHWEPLS